MKVSNAQRFTGSLELTIHFDGTHFGVSIMEADGDYSALIREITLAPGKRFDDDEAAFDDAAQVAIGFAGFEDSRVYSFAQLTDEGDECVVWRDRDTAVLMAR